MITIIIIIIYFYSTVSLHFSCTTIAMPLLSYYLNISNITVTLFDIIGVETAQLEVEFPARGRGLDTAGG